MKKVRRGKPAEVIGAENDAVAAIVLPENDHGVDHSAIEGVEQVTGIIEAHLDREHGIMCIQSGEQGRKFGGADVGGDPQ